MNNTFEAVYTEYNVSTNQNTNYTYQLDCMGYYLVGLQPLQYLIGRTLPIIGLHGQTHTTTPSEACIRVMQTT